MDKITTKISARNIELYLAYQTLNITMTDIAVIYHISRERARQIITKMAGSSKPTKIKIGGLAQLSRITGYSINTLKHVFTPVINFKYTRPELFEKLEELGKGLTCPSCGGEKRFIGKLCHSCGAKGRWGKMNYEQKLRHLILCENWRKRNPERTKEMQAKASKKYQNKLKGKYITIRL